MRGTELVVGGILVVAGLLVPLPPSVDFVPSDGSLEASAILDNATVTGSATVEASEAATRVVGQTETLINGRMKVEVFEYHENHRTTLHIERWTTLSDGFNYPQVEAEYGHAEVKVQGTEETVVFTWPDPTAEAMSAHFQLTAPELWQVETQPGPKATRLSAYVGGLTYHGDGPNFVLGNPAPEHIVNPVTNVSFQGLDASGGLQIIVVGRSEITAEHAEGTDEFETWTRSGTGTGTQGVGTELGARYRYAVITLHEGHQHMDLDGVETTLVSQNLTWNLNGTISFDAKEGSLRMGNQSWPLEADSLEVEGDTTFRSQAFGDPDLHQGVGPLSYSPPLTTSESEIGGELNGDAAGVTYNGDPLMEPVQVAGPRAIPDEVTFTARLLGIALVIWAFARKGTILTLALLKKDVLAHPRRRMIYDHLQTHGFAHLRQLERETKISATAITHHMEVLKRKGFVQCVHRSNRRIFFIPSNVWTQEEMHRLATLSDPTRQRIAKELVHKRSVRQQDLSDLLSISHSSASRQINSLVEAGLVEGEGRRDIAYKPSPLLREWVQALQSMDVQKRRKSGPVPS